MDTQPKKYIRTFAGDMEMLKKGGMPDLVPLSESKPPPTPPERLIEASPVTPLPTGGPIPSSNEGHVSASPLSVPLSRDEPLSPPLPEPEEEKPIPLPPKVADGESPIKTYESDFSDRMKEEHASPVTVLAAEQDALPEKIETPESVRHSRSNMLYTIAGAVLIVAGGVGVYITYTKHLAAIAPVIFTPAVSAPIAVDDRQEISGVGTALIQAIEQSVNRLIASGSIRFLYMTSGDNVFSALQTPAPDVLIRNLKTDGSMAGVVNVGGNPSNTLGTGQSPFFILSVASYGETFSGMLSWESSMPRDLTELFPPYVVPIVSTTTSSAVATTTATTTPKVKTKATTATTTQKVASTTTPTAIASFRDEVIGNHDVRIYRDAAGRSVLLYGYWNQATLIIARTPSAFTEILNRLANAKAQR
ncbi:MAG: hypothetical protein NTU85_01000 [Candidatus Kaiserbacteria bacterium]|nr:hypothetical protein [Candidatus Kaiserbacteria bacterium]